MIKTLLSFLLTVLFLFSAVSCSGNVKKPETTNVDADTTINEYPRSIKAEYKELAASAPETVYHTKGEENGLTDSIYWFSGTVKEISSYKMENGLSTEYFILNTDKGDVFCYDLYNYTLASAGDQKAFFEEEGADYSFPEVGERIVVYTIYQGFSERMNMPAVVYGVPEWLIAFNESGDLPDETKETETTEPPADSETEQIATDSFVGDKTDFTGLGIGEIGRIDNEYVGLQYVKSMSFLPTGLGSEEVPDGFEAILGFFEFYNGSSGARSISPDDIKCYADGTQANRFDTYIKITADGVDQYHNEKIDGGCQMLSVQDFCVRKGWSELKFFYKSKCIWTVRPDEVKTEDYQRTTLFNINCEKDVTETDHIIYSEDYEIQYKGVSSHKKETIISNTDYVVFKFHIKNNMSKALDMSTMGYNMRAYQNNTFLGDASFTLNETIDGFINIYDVDSTEAGMSSDIYVAFEIPSMTGNVCMAYDDGWVNSHLCGYVFDVLD